MNTLTFSSPYITFNYIFLHRHERFYYYFAIAFFFLQQQSYGRLFFFLNKKNIFSRRLHPSFRQFLQQDSQEFLIYFLDEIHGELRQPLEQTCLAEDDEESEAEDCSVGSPRGSLSSLADEVCRFGFFFRLDFSLDFFFYWKELCSNASIVSLCRLL